MDRVARLFEVSQRQYGLVSAAQARRLVTRGQLRGLSARGVILPWMSGVWIVAGSQPRWRQRAMGACLAYGPPVAVSGVAAARLWELEGIDSPVVEVTVPPGRSGRHVGVVTRRRVLAETEMTTRFDIPVTTVPRTLLDLAGCVPVGVVATAFDDAIVRRLVTAEGVAAYLAHRPGRRPGQGVLRGLVEDRRGEDATSESVGELRVHRWLVKAGLPPPVRQHRVVVAGVARRLDLAYPDLRIAIEFQGFRHHGRARGRFDADQRRLTELALAGWLVVLVTSVMSEAEVVGLVRRARTARGAA